MDFSLHALEEEQEEEKERSTSKTIRFLFPDFPVFMYMCIVCVCGTALCVLYSTDIGCNDTANQFADY